MTFSETLTCARKRRGWSQEELAARVQVSRQAVSKWETGDAMPDLPKLLALADALELSLDVLCGRVPPGAAAPAASALPLSDSGPAAAAVSSSADGPAAAAAPLSDSGAAAPLSASAAPSPAPAASAPAALTRGKLLLAALLCMLLGAIFSGALLWGWTQRDIVPAEEAAAQSLGVMARELTVSGLGFVPQSDSRLGFHFTPSICGEGLTYEITFTGSDGQSLTFDAPCGRGVCTGEAVFPDSATNAAAPYSAAAANVYNVTVSVTDGTVLRALAVAADLHFTETDCTWTPLTE